MARSVSATTLCRTPFEQRQHGYGSRVRHGRITWASPGGEEKATGKLDLRLLEDDKRFFAVYNPALTVRQEVFKQYPQLQRIFTPISERLDTETLRELNCAVDVQGKSPENVARSWLRENGFIE